MFDEINDLDYIYIYSGKKMYKSKVIKFSKIDSETIFVKAENEGNLIFEKGYKFKKGDKIYALNENCFRNEKISFLVNKLKNYNNQINKIKQEIEESRRKIEEYNAKIKWNESNIKNISDTTIEIKQEITKEKINEKVIS